MLLQEMQQAGGDQLVFDRTEPRRTLRMAFSHFVLETIWVADVSCLQGSPLNSK